MTTHAQPVQSLQGALRAGVCAAVDEVLPDLGPVDPLVRPSDHADAQSNVAMAVAKKVGRRPAEIAQDVAERLSASTGLVSSAEVSGPGFINITLADQALWEQTRQRLTAPDLGVALVEAGRTTVVDFASPNVAKQMHVGHLRSTVIGDSLVRVLRHLGGTVIPQNHLGDWGAQFGMLVQYLQEHPDEATDLDFSTEPQRVLTVLDRLYKAAQKRYQSDPEFVDRARATLVRLQSGDPEIVARWRHVVDVSVTAFDAQFADLDVTLTLADVRAESSYNDLLPDVVDALQDKGLAVESQGALCVFTEGVVGPEGNPVPLILRKSDGGFGYVATDFAAIRHRFQTLHADRVLYVVDSRQSLHFSMVFDTAKRAGWIPENGSAEFIGFGTVMGPDGRPFKTRSGETVSLSSLVDSARQAARTVIEEKNAERTEPLSDEEVTTIANQAGLAGIKYADLSNSRIKDYQFDVDRMVALQGDTGVYLQYAHTRIASIVAKSKAEGVLPADLDDESLGRALGDLVDPNQPLTTQERNLALLIDGFDDVLVSVAHTSEPHRLCNFLYKVAKAYTEFYGACPVLAAPSEALRVNRLALCWWTKCVLAQGLDLLGIAAPARM